MRLPHVALAFAVTLAVLPAASSARNPKPARTYAGFDSNDYPGDAVLPALRHQFSFVGYWLTTPPGATTNPWLGKRATLLRAGFGFLVVANGRLDKEIIASQKSGTPPAALGRKDAAAAAATARRERFPPHTILFLDQEDGGRMLPEQSDYILAWTQAIAAAGFHPGIYASGQPVNDGRGPDGRPATITTIQDLRQQIAARHLHPVAVWVYQDACPPAPGCVVPNPPAPNQSGTLDSTAWQYAQSPRRSSTTKSCAATYSSEGQCYAPTLPHLPLDLSSSLSPDPSHGR